MPFKVIIRNDLSLAQLAALSRNGRSVMKSPHVGNLYPNNLIIASLGIFVNLYDRTIGEVDRNAHPHLVIVNSRSEKVANPKILTTHSRVQCQSQFFPDYFPIGQSLVHGHVQALQKALPGAQLMTYTEYLRRNADLVMTILEIATALQPAKWERFVQSDGTIFNKSAPEWQNISTWNDVKAREIYGLTDQNKGLIIPLTFTVLLLGIVGGVTKKTAEAYHLSGPDMFKYVEGMACDLSQIYDLVRKHLSGLPETLVFNLIPVADMRFVAIDSQKTALNELVEAYLVFTHEEKQLKQTAGAYPMMDIGKPGVWQQLLERNDKVAKQLRAAIAICDFVFYKIEQATYTSQYDLLLGKQLYLHPFGVEKPISDVSVAIKIMKEIRSRQHKPRRPLFVEDMISGGIK